MKQFLPDFTIRVHPSGSEECGGLQWRGVGRDVEGAHARGVEDTAVGQEADLGGDVGIVVAEPRLHARGGEARGESLPSTQTRAHKDKRKGDAGERSHCQDTRKCELFTKESCFGVGRRWKEGSWGKVTLPSTISANTDTAVRTVIFQTGFMKEISYRFLRKQEE